MTPNVLIVEDEILIANLIKSYIEPHGYKCVGIAIDYNQAIQLLKTKSVDVGVLDISISGSKNGIDIANYINSHQKIPFIFLTSHNDYATMTQLETTRPSAYLSKPFKQIDVVTALNLAYKVSKPKEIYHSITIGKSIYQIKLEDLMYVKSNHVYVDVFLREETILMRSSISNIIDLFPTEVLVRISKSVAVNPAFIKMITSHSVELEHISFKLSDNYRHNLTSERS